MMVEVRREASGTIVGDGALPPCRDQLDAIGGAWHGASGDWRDGVARAAETASAALDAGVSTASPAAATIRLDPAAQAVLVQRLAHGRPCAVWSGTDGRSYAAAAIGEAEGDFVWVRRVSPPFSWQEVLALRHVAAIATPLLDLDRRRAQAELLAEELRHRCGNDLQLVASLLGFHARHAATGEARAALGAIADQVTALALARRTPENDLAVALRSFCDALAAQAAVRGIALSLSIDGDLGPVSKTRAGLVLIAVNEVVTNALKHAFRDAAHGTISVRAALRDDRLHVTVDDDGLPLPHGAANPRTGSGLDLVARLLAGGRGALALPEPGTKRFVVTVPAR